MSLIGPNSLIKVINGLFDIGYLAISQITAQGAQIGSANPANPGAIAGAGGNIGTFISGAGQNSVAAAQDTVLATLAIPANAWDQAARVLTVTAAGKFGATANSKTLKIFFGNDLQTVGNAIITTATTAIATSGAQTTNGGGWNADAQVVKFGALGSNTQLGINMGIIAGAAHLGTSAPVSLTATESAITYITLTANTPTAATDAVCNWLELAWNN